MQSKKRELGIQVIRVRLYPNETQKYLLANLFGQGRVVYNSCLKYKEEEHSKGNKVGLNELSKYFHAVLLDEKTYLDMFNTNIIKTEIANLVNAYNRFYKKTSKKPVCKKKWDKQSVKFNSPTAISRTNLDNGKINLTKNLKNFKFRTSDRDTQFLILHKKDIQNIVISKTSTDNYYAAIMFRTNDKVNTKPIPSPINDAIGLDLGINSFIVDSNGVEYENLRSFRSVEKKIAKYQRQLSKKDKKSNNYKKLKRKIARLHEKAKFKKENYLHYLSNKVVSENQVITIEDLKVSKMMKNHKLAKSIQELSLYEFRRQLTYKALQRGRQLVVVDQFFASTKTCSQCGHKKTMSLSDRIYHCDHCGLEMSRDLNAAINIKVEGMKILGLWRPDDTLAEGGSADCASRSGLIPPVEGELC